MANEANVFLQAFSTDPNFFVSHPFLWKVSLDANVSGAINSALSKANESWSASVSPNALTRNGTLLVARQMTIPQESSEFTPIGVENRGGFLPGYGLTQRTDFLSRSFSLNVLETGSDIEHGFFRPWLIALGIDGLTNFGLKTNITVTQYNNDGSKRKGYVFEDAFPTAVEGYSLNYNDGDFIEKSVTFACKNYKQL
tara:strand:+ start:792 stop:1382 length:591 start_codon:yes stop_codon:yes gene_type:complete